MASLDNTRTSRVSMSPWRRMVAPTWMLLVLSLALTACAFTTSDPTSRSSTLVVDAGAHWLVLPFENDTGQPTATRQIDALIRSGLSARGLPTINSNAGNGAALTVSGQARYALSGRILKWDAARTGRSRGTVKLQIQVVDLDNGETLRTADAEKKTPRREGMTAAASGVVERLLAPIKPLTRRAVASTADTESARSVTSVDSASQLLVANRRDTGSGILTAADVRVAATDAPTRPLPSTTAESLQGRATAFFYGTDVPVTLLQQFDRVVLEHDNLVPSEIAALNNDDVASFAYLSVGEVGPDRVWDAPPDMAWSLGKNSHWNSAVMDLANPAWISFLLNRVDQLMQGGHQGLFLDTMDSFTLVAKEPVARAAQQAGLVSLITQMRQRHPEIRLIANRGFEVLDAVAPHLEAVAAESLYANWNNAKRTYGTVEPQDREWLLGQLNAARDTHGLDVIAIDYVEPAQRDRAVDVARRIASHGFVPWVATPSLDYVGVGAIDVQAREVMMLFDSNINGTQGQSEVHRLLAMPLEYYGFVPVYHDVKVNGLPPMNLGGRYAGIAYWSREPKLAAPLVDWFSRQMDDGVKVALMGSLGAAEAQELFVRAGVELTTPLDANTTSIDYQDALIGFERPLPPRQEWLGPALSSVGKDNTTHLRLRDGASNTTDLVVTGPWGGLATAPGVLDYDIDPSTYWIVDPFEFLARALDLHALPMPDVTSEGGKRLWFAHIDGDAMPSWAEMPGRQLGAEVVRDRILKRWTLPHTISVVEAEMTRMDHVADRRARMKSVAREIFAMPQVEIATHTFSHPFRWKKLQKEATSGTYNIDVGDYQYSPEREVAGSAAYIDEQLAPQGKRTEVVLWSGDALPDEGALASAEAAGLVNLNGGYSAITRAEPSVTNLTPMVRTVGKYTQVYAPIMNENVYTGEWTGPFDGFRRVIETLSMTDKPRRIKPINIYYHFYIGTKIAAIRSLEEVYRWSVQQDIHPISVSDYAERVARFRSAGVARLLDGRFQFTGLGSLSSVRVLSDDTSVDSSASSGVILARQLHDGLYLKLDGSRRPIVALTEAPILGAGREAAR